MVFKLSVVQDTRIVHSSLLCGRTASICATKCCHHDILYKAILNSNNNRSKPEDKSN